MNDIYNDIAVRTGGSIYIGVVGPVRTGKSTFIKHFMERLVIPNIESDYRRERASDELPQSSGGRTIMTTEPKFIPEEAVRVNLGTASFDLRMIDCVGYNRWNRSLHRHFSVPAENPYHRSHGWHPHPTFSESPTFQAPHPGRSEW